MNFAAAVWRQDVTGSNRVKQLNLSPCAGLILRQGRLNGSTAEIDDLKHKKILALNEPLALSSKQSCWLELRCPPNSSTKKQRSPVRHTWS